LAENSLRLAISVAQSEGGSVCSGIIRGERGRKYFQESFARFLGSIEGMKFLGFKLLNLSQSVH
jgi:hypothetical protein